jgi:hypothetical protein
LYTLSSALGAAIEQSVVDNLNALRPMWDPDKEYGLYSFVRQNQVFPDVLLQMSAPDATPKIILGIELKGWWVLAKEGEPSFRYTVCTDACAEADLLAVFPRTLDEVISGAPRPLDPFVVEARYAAARRNYYWEHERGATGNSAMITPATHRTPYPKKNDRFNDGGADDKGKNFGRPRGGTMADFIDSLEDMRFSGIPIKAWRDFFKIFTGTMTEARLKSRMSAIAKAHGIGASPESEAAVDQLAEKIFALLST